MKTVFDRRSFVTGLTAAAAVAPSPICAWQPTGRHGAKESLLPGIPGLPAASPESVGVVADISARIGIFMRRHINAGHLSGGVTALARRGKLIHFAAHGMQDVESGTPIETVPANREITIRDLATHTSGLNGFLLDIPASAYCPTSGVEGIQAAARW